MAPCGPERGCRTCAAAVLLCCAALCCAELRLARHGPLGDVLTCQQCPQNIKMVDKLKELAAAKGLTAGQLALAWVHNQGDDVVPIPGKRSAAAFRPVARLLDAGPPSERLHVLAAC